MTQKLMIKYRNLCSKPMEVFKAIAIGRERALVHLSKPCSPALELLPHHTKRLRGKKKIKGKAIPVTGREGP
jgi:hypothetical protein